MSGEVLCLNAGSSSLKFALYRPFARGEPVRVAGGKVDRIGIAPHFHATAEGGAAVCDRTWPDGAHLSHEDLLGEVLEWVGDRLKGTRLSAIGHRIVHGGEAFAWPCLVDDEVLAKLDALSPLAPLHQPHGLAAIRAARALRPGVPQVACFDTAFHRTRPDVATRLALPRAVTARGVRRYGFHGISYEYVARQLALLDPALASGRVIVAHLGNGASLCAIRNGASVDTTMGFTPLDGLVMGTRCGTLDPGAVLYLFQTLGMDAGAVEHLLYNESGLLGVSGISSDMRALLDSHEEAAAAAIELFTYRLAREAGGLVSALGGLDGLVFTAGIGENAPEIRTRACARLAWLGIEIDPAANARGNAVISTQASRVIVRVVPTDEERMIALHAAAVLQDEGTPAPQAG